jgi:hypothetical protein
MKTISLLLLLTICAYGKVGEPYEQMERRLGKPAHFKITGGSGHAYFGTIYTMILKGVIHLEHYSDVSADRSGVLMKEQTSEQWYLVKEEFGKQVWKSPDGLTARYSATSRTLTVFDATGEALLKP